VRVAIRLYFRYVGVSFRGQMQYRASAIMSTIGLILLTGLEFLIIWALFDRFGSLPGWSLPQVAMLYGMTNIAFGITQIIARGFDDFPAMIKSGDLDRVLLRPRPVAFQVLAQHLQVARVGRVLQGAVVLGWGISNVGIAWTLPKAALLLGSMASGVCIFTSLFILQATMAIFTIETLEIMNTLTYGGVESTQYPLSIYTQSFRRFFLFIVPLASMNYLPVLAVTDRTADFGVPAFAPWLSPLAGLAFLLVTLRIWGFGIRHYRSTGS
jgi:ABC-2 type transport system permease protein